MAGGGFHVAGPVKHYEGKVTPFVVFTCIVAATGGLIFGYDIGISGGVSGMDDFLKEFFPSVYRRKHNAEEDNYCKFDSQALQAFTSSLYIAGLLASIPAAYITRYYGRRPTIILGGVSFLAGSLIDAGAMNIGMLIAGRVLLGAGIGLGNQSVPLYLSEMAPAAIRGGLNIMFQLMTCAGILAANLINYGTVNIRPWGWRLSLGLAAVPAVVMAGGGFFLPETPNSLAERGRVEEARRVLRKVRGVPDVEAEMADILAASTQHAGNRPFRSLLSRKNVAPLVMAVLIPCCQQMTGINVVNFYAPILFLTIGFGNDAALYSAVITGTVILLGAIVSIVAVDKLGRRFFFLQGGIQMLVAEVVIGALLQAQLSRTEPLPKVSAIAVVVMICVYVAGFAWSWGPLGWLVPSEIFPLETRSAGQAVTVFVNLLFTFGIAQSFLSMLCHMKFGIFYFFAGWLVFMTAFVYFFLPETKNVPIEEMVHVWRAHWFWKHVVPPEDALDMEISTSRLEAKTQDG